MTDDEDQDGQKTGWKPSEEEKPEWVVLVTRKHGEEVRRVAESLKMARMIANLHALKAVKVTIRNPDGKESDCLQPAGGFWRGRSGRRNSPGTQR